MTGPLQVLVDGAPADGGWMLDRGLHYGDGLFETVIVRGGRLRFEALHRQRLERGCQRLGIEVDASSLWRQARALAESQGDCTLKILLTRGSSPARGYTPPRDARPRVIHLAYPPARPGEVPGRVRVSTLRAQLGENPALAGIKHCNRLEQILGRSELQHTGAFEGLMGTGSGRLVSGTMSNVFLWQDGGYVTPLLDQCGIEGVTRAVVLREAARCGLGVREARVPMDALAACKGLFITNARLGVVPAHELDGRDLRVDPVVQALAERVASLAD